MFHMPKDQLWTEASYKALTVRSNKLLELIAGGSPGKYPHFSLAEKARYVHFTGWKLDRNIDTGVVLPERGAVAQFLDWRNGADGPFFYCNLPNLKAEQYSRGALFEIGTERIFPDITDGNLRVCLEMGLERLYEAAEEYGVNAT